MIKLISSVALATCLSLTSANAQCSDLAITGSIAPGATITFDVTGAPADSNTIVLMSLEAGPLSFDLPFGTLNLGILPPFAPVGYSDSFSITLPDVPMTPEGISFDLSFQALSLGFEIAPPGPPSLSLCESDVETLTAGS